MQTVEGPAREAVDRVYRDDYGRIYATLVRTFGDFQLAEDAIQEAMVSALQDWSANGIPENTAAWMFTAARHKGLDAARRANQRPKRQAPVDDAEDVPDVEADDTDIGPF